jgi:mono/diheme cytochrome c family protein
LGAATRFYKKEEYMKYKYSIFLFTFGILFLTPPNIYPQPTIHRKDTPEADSTLKSGQELYLKNCSSCHGEKGQGFAGPNLTDNYWLHGGGIKNIIASINDGISSKGMIAWKIVFSPKEIQVIADYIHSLRGTNPPKAKRAEGILHNE